MFFLSLITKSSQHKHPPNNNPNRLLLNIILQIHTRQQEQNHLIIIDKYYKFILICNKKVHTIYRLVFSKAIWIQEAVGKIYYLLEFGRCGLGLMGVVGVVRWGFGWVVFGVGYDAGDVVEELFEYLFGDVLGFQGFFLAGVVYCYILAYAQD